MQRGPRSSSSSCSLHAKGEGAEEDEIEKQEEHDSQNVHLQSEPPSLFGTESDDEPAVSRVDNDKTAQESKPVSLDRIQILDSQLEPPTVSFTDEGETLPAEFELSDPIALKFAVEPVHHSTEMVSLFAPGDSLDVDTRLFDESTFKDFEDNQGYSHRTIRWRLNEDGERECNSRVVEWDDGTFSLYVEGKWYDLGKESFVQGTELLCIDQQNCLQALHAVTTGHCAVAATTDESDDECEIVSVVEPSQMQRKPKTKRVAVLGNPVKEKEAKLRKIEQERRDRELMERKQRNLQERYMLPSLDQLHDDEEDSRMAEHPQKRTRGSRTRPGRSRKSTRRDDDDGDFIEQDGDDEMELGEEYEEEEELQTGTDEEETDNQITNEEEQATSSGADVTAPAVRDEKEAEDAEVDTEDKKTHRRPVVLGDEEDDDDDDETSD